MRTPSHEIAKDSPEGCGWFMVTGMKRRPGSILDQVGVPYAFACKEQILNLLQLEDWIEAWASDAVEVIYRPDGQETKKDDGPLLPPPVYPRLGVWASVADEEAWASTAAPSTRGPWSEACSDDSDV